MVFKSCKYLVANYYNEEKRIPKEKGFYWYRKAAINGCVYAQYELAEYYRNNSSPTASSFQFSMISKNESKAFKWYLRLANENGLRANYFVAKCYRGGIGTDRNLKEAEKWVFRISYCVQPPITLNEFLNGSDANVSLIPIKYSNNSFKFKVDIEFL